jgi:predicted transcriptional regulator
LTIKIPGDSIHTEDLGGLVVSNRAISTLTISIPPEMAEKLDEVRKAESRTRSELVCEALRTYFAFCSRFPVVEPTKADLKSIERGRAAFSDGECVALDQLLHHVEPARDKARPNGLRSSARKRSRTYQDRS